MREPEIAGSRKTPPARLKTRAEFLRAAKGRRLRSPCFSLQMVARPQAGLEAPEVGPPRFGFTVTKKLGKAVLRNRIRRRLKEALRLTPELSARPGHDYVILAQPAALTEDFVHLQHELGAAFAAIHGPRPPRAAKDRTKDHAKDRIRDHGTSRNRQETKPPATQVSPTKE